MMNFLSIILVLSAILCSHAQEGSLDQTFGNEGKVIFNRYTDQNTSFLTIQNDEKIILTGYYVQDFKKDYVTIRLNQDGSVDSTYGIDGVAISPLLKENFGKSIAIQDDGKILVAGSNYGTYAKDFSVVRHNPDGSLDSTFNHYGFVTTYISLYEDDANSIVVQSNGKIVVAGTSYNGSDKDFALVRYDIDGSIDSTFNNNGIVITPIGSGDDIVSSMILQEDGRIVVVGFSFNGSDDDFAIVRYNVDGSLDTTFNHTGIVLTPIGDEEDKIYSITLPEDGTILVAGQVTTLNGNNYAIVRYKNDGTIDSTFNQTGIVLIPNCFGCLTSYDGFVVTQKDGKIIFGGTGKNDSNYDFMIQRYTSSGIVDSSFGENGMILTDFENEYDFLNAICIQEDKVYAAGLSLPLSRSFSHIIIARYDLKLPDDIVTTKSTLPHFYTLFQNYPNPFNPSTTIEFNLPKSEFVELKVYNVLGKVVSTLISRKLNSGKHTYVFDGSRLSSGVYYYQLNTGDYKQVKKMFLIK